MPEEISKKYDCFKLLGFQKFNYKMISYQFFLSSYGDAM